MKFKLITLTVLAVMTVTSFAQSLTGRSSTINYSYVYGAGGDTHNGSNGNTVTDLLSSDLQSDGFTGMTSGTLPGNQAYAAFVDSSMSHAYSVYGSLSNFNYIGVEADSYVNATQSGLGSALMASSNPGNELILNFDVAAPIDYHFYGFLSYDPSEQGPGNVIALQKWDGIVWQNVFISYTLPDQQGSFDYTDTLVSGEYRIRSAIALSAINNESVSGVYAYGFEVVPEPVTMFAIAPAIMFFARKRKK
jgi:hypothetical protein